MPQAEELGEVIFEDRDVVVRMKKSRQEFVGIIQPIVAVYVNKKTPRGEEVVSRRPLIGQNYLCWSPQA
jgi:hypothetical protein